MKIEVRWVGELSASQLRMIELEENLHRRELTPAMRTKVMVELAAVTAERLREEAEAGGVPDAGGAEGGVHPPPKTAPSEDTSALEPQGPEGLSVAVDNNPPGGAPEKPDSQAKVAEAIWGLASGLPRHSSSPQRISSLANVSLIGIPSLR
jgi:hypothetical protein